MKPEATLTSDSSLSDWMKLRTFLFKHQQFEEAQMRWLLMRRKENGLDQHTRKIGRWLYLNEPGFLQWVENHSER